MKDVMNKNSDHEKYYELIVSTEVLLNILDAIDLKYTISETKELNRLNSLYKMSITTFRELYEQLGDSDDDNIEYLTQALPSSLRDSFDYLEANYKDSLRPKLLSAHDYLTELSTSTADSSNIPEGKGSIDQIIDDFIHLPDINESKLPKSLQDLRDHTEEEAIFKFTFDHNTDILAVNGIRIRRLTTTGPYSEILTEAMNNPGEPVKSSSKMSKFISELDIPNPLKDLFFPVRGKSRFMIVPEITKEMLDRKKLGIEELSEELLKLAKK